MEKLINLKPIVEEWEVNGAASIGKNGSYDTWNGMRWEDGKHGVRCRQQGKEE